MRIIIIILIHVIIIIPQLLFSQKFINSQIRISNETVWSPSNAKLSSILNNCNSQNSINNSNIKNCVLESIKNNGASIQALEFIKSHDSSAFVACFREMGVIDIAYINYLFRANENYSVYLVNGNPSIIDVDEIDKLNLKSMEQDSLYKLIIKDYPRATIFPSDRFNHRYPAMEQNSSGGQTFVVEYKLLNACHACEQLGIVSFAFDFDKNSNYIANRFHRIESIVKSKNSLYKVKGKSKQLIKTEKIKVKKGNEIVLNLPSNHSTGFEWKLADSLNNDFIKLISRNYQEESTDTKNVAKAGIELWQFKAIKKGKTRIRFNYIREWEANTPAAQVLEYEIIIK